MIMISEKAAKRIQSLKSEEEQSEASFLRVEIKKGGCSGLSYKMNFDASIQSSDMVFEQFGQKIVVDNNSFLFVAGMTLDYSGGLNGKGFTFTNPNATKTCGCGTSFNVKTNPTPSSGQCESE
jgi:iron-sulfur cluster assembly protein